ncbi:MAG: hypothetical protein JW837_18185 [Sedimentisphaerales bacterium]|nr:hypothetical protein [Sedimentisphaerales bacterium]
MYLALEFKQPDIELFRASLSYKDYLRWSLYYRKRPFGVEAADYRQALTTCILANVNRDGKKKPTPFTPEDFMTGKKPPKEQSWQQMKMMLEAFCNRFKNGR